MSCLLLSQWNRRLQQANQRLLKNQIPHISTKNGIPCPIGTDVVFEMTVVCKCFECPRPSVKMAVYASANQSRDWVTWARHVAKRFYARSSAQAGGVIQLNKYLKSDIVRGRCSKREALLDKKWVPRSEVELCIKEFEHEYWQGQGDNAGNEHSYVEGVSRALHDLRRFIMTWGSLLYRVWQ